MKDKEKHIKWLLYIGLAVPIILHILASGTDGNLIALTSLILFLIASYQIMRKTLVLDVSTLFFFTMGLMLTLISISGFILVFVGLKLTPINYLGLSAIILILVYTIKGKHKKLSLDYKKLAVVGGVFLIALSVYFYPSLPNGFSPCTFGFDCSLHTDYAKNIYATGELLPPIWQWRYYPSGFHITASFLTQAIEQNAPSFGNFMYPYAAIISALIVGMIGLILYDKIKLLYLLIFTIAVLTSVYLISDLVHYGFYGSILGNYYCILFIIVMSYFIKQDNKKMKGLIILILFGGLLAYQILIVSFLVMTFLIYMVFYKKKLKEKIKTILVILIALGLLFTVYTGYGYAKALTYEFQPAKTEYVPAILNMTYNSGHGLWYAQINGSFYLNDTDLHTEKIYAPHEQYLPLLLSQGLSIEKFQEYIEIGRMNLNGVAAGAIIFPKISYFGYLTILLFLVGVWFIVKDNSELLPFILAGSLYTTTFMFMNMQDALSVYYSTKALHFFTYFLLAGAVYGLGRLMSNIKLTKKTGVVFIIMFITLYSCGMLTVESFYALTGDRTELYETDFNWALLEFNRFQRCRDMFYIIERENYGIQGWLEERNKEEVK